ncbi:hypothetical protein BDV24DRAFT_86316 [Aspergillus arachidicola]|uniref:NAD-dependent epimerase/dehydratase domain-containing protein n=1 Tax=Aspergillus arachidicola TaxID=656916 RepID=A0A5N6XZN0_9EURO|nr:hypothetical protein BDV24DRAFT_86316 [Aspergillus arachidicola]
MASDQSKKPAVLIVGGLGFIGRHLALYIHENNLASEVRLVDKVLPQLAWLAPEFQEACSKDKFVQADASREQHFPRVFDRANGEQFDYVINCGGETRHSQPDDVYELRNYNLTVTLAREVARRGIRSYVECSTAHVYKSGSSPRKEDDKLQPWHKLAKWKMKASDEISKIPGLNYCLLRLPHVYGEYCSGFFAMGVCLARVHLEMEKDLELLYTGDVKMNTLYVKDAASALWKSAEWRATAPTDGSAPIAFNVVDHGNTRQQDIADALSTIFGMKCSFLGSLASQFAKLNLDDVIDDMNEECLQVWAELMEQKKIERPGPISPFLERDVFKDQDMSLDGTLFEKTTGWKPTRERFDADGVRDMVESYKRMGWWP